MTRKKGQFIDPAIPLERLLVGEGARRSYDNLEREARRDERLLSAFKDALFSNAAASIERKDAQRQKANRPRGKGDDGRTMRDLIDALAKQHHDEKPREIWPHLGSAIKEWADECEPKTIDGKESYRYQHASGKERTITYKQFCEVLRQARKT